MQIFFCYFCDTIILIYVSALYDVQFAVLCFDDTFGVVSLGKHLNQVVCIIIAYLIVAKQSCDVFTDFVCCPFFFFVNAHDSHSFCADFNDLRGSIELVFCFDF